MKILAVDDDPVFLNILGLVLDEAGYQDLTFASDAVEALELIARDDTLFECFLLDILMPGIDGLELCSRVRAMPRYGQTPILMLTSATDEISIDRAMTLGATDYVTKPLQGIQLGARIRSAAILNEQMGKTLALQDKVHRLETTISSFSRSSFSDVLEILSVPHCLMPDQLEMSLMALPNGVYAISTFALRIEDAEDLYSRFAPRDIGDVITAVAAHIEAQLGVTRNRFAYYGNGIFGCVVFARSGRMFAELRVNRFGIDPTVSMSGIVCGLDSVRLHSDQQDHVLPLLSGQQAVSALEHAVAKVSRHDTQVLIAEENHVGANRLEPVKALLADNMHDIEGILSNIFLDYDVPRKTSQAMA
ncbi:MAG: response regulator [Pseudotabrizicola sp.]|uniref:response regulator n=1 Tax=Pseudotabrizicola sp. TaxID=2939647 RepID=UPI0027205D77|nr:response regulator [Pseudotabrizicola sp.]MDO8884103.1 response regulator [Pseudotabrizicola sp.]MDP2081577.1 response regulator [Pseudotabrizicola sp.]MDZ7576337.1 response regulator [Pseudotabrizicola sp.]